MIYKIDYLNYKINNINKKEIHLSIKISLFNLIKDLFEYFKFVTIL